MVSTPPFFMKSSQNSYIWSKFKKTKHITFEKDAVFLFLEKLKRLHTTSSLLITFRRVKGTYLSSLLNSFYCNSEPTRTITDAKDSLENPNNFGLKSDYPTVERE